MRITVLFSLVIQGSLSWAGVGAHGGNIVSCEGQPSVTLDYFNASLPTISGPNPTVDISEMSEEEAYQFIRARLSGSPFQNIFDVHANGIGPIEQWVAADLKNIDDSGEPYILPPHCVRETAAARQGLVMYGDPFVLAKLSPAQRGLLRAHEVFYRLSGNESSAPVRDLFRVMLARNFNVDRMYDAVGVLGHSFAMWEYAKQRTWSVSHSSEVKISGKLEAEKIISRDKLIFSFWNSGGDVWNPSARLHLECDLKTQSCVVRRVESSGKAPRFQNCVVKMPREAVMTFECPDFGRKILSFSPL